MSTNQRVLLASVALLAVGTAVGWNASRMAQPKTPAADTTAFVLDQPAGNLTPSEEYRAPAPMPAVTRTHVAPRRAVARSHRSTPRPSGILLPAGTPIAITVNQSLSTKSAYEGQTWSGTVAQSVYQNGRVLIPAGSSVHGVVAVARPAERGERATLQLAVRSIEVRGRTHSVRASSEAVVAGSPRARNVGAIAGGAAAGALLGRAIAHSTRGTLIGAAVGGGAATAAVAASKGYQASIPAGKELDFTTSGSVRIRA